MTDDTSDDEETDNRADVRFSDLEPRLQRTLERLSRLPPDHRRRLPDPENPSRPELEVLSRIRSMRAAVEQHERDQSAKS